jgi:hypothetical protein
MSTTYVCVAGLLAGGELGVATGRCLPLGDTTYLQIIHE